MDRKGKRMVLTQSVAKSDGEFWKGRRIRRKRRRKKENIFKKGILVKRVFSVAFGMQMVCCTHLCAVEARSGVGWPLLAHSTDLQIPT